jgi:hypothetical protein
MFGKEGKRQSVPTELEDMLSQRSLPLLGLCFFALKAARKKEFPCREYLQKLNAESTTMEELVDFYGAQKNICWFTFRESIAAQKLFTAVYYDMLHLHTAINRYTLLETCSDLVKATDKIRRKLKKAIIRLSRNLTDQAKEIGIITKPVETDFKKCRETSFNEQLPIDRKVRHVYKVGETVVYLASQFLNLAEDRQVEEILKEREKEEYPSLLPMIVNEEQCRIVEAQFHNLQSMYDTYIFESDMESQNRNLSYLRSHISIIYHLMKNATNLIHYYVRHMSKLSRSGSNKMTFPLETDELLSIVFDYLFTYARDYMDSAVHLCRSMILSYSEKKRIEVPIPNYRGFHVRPSTLISKIVAHYGSEVSMYLDGEQYNAASPLDLFRANEAINAMKRRYIADLLSKRPELQHPVPKEEEERKKELQILFLEMMKADQLMVYELNIPIDEVSPVGDETVAEFASRCIKHFQSLAKVDVNSNLTVTFEGDNRSLNDLRILAENGYGEDRFGNNIVLTEELAYLRR